MGVCSFSCIGNLRLASRKAGCLGFDGGPVSCKLFVYIFELQIVNRGVFADAKGGSDRFSVPFVAVHVFNEDISAVDAALEPEQGAALREGFVYLRGGGAAFGSVDVGHVDVLRRMGMSSCRGEW